MPTVFISYSHDSSEHVDRVLALADRLITDGVDTRIDRYALDPSEGWPVWMHKQIAEADFVVLVCTPTYRRRYDREETPHTGLGATWEGMIAQQLHYEAGARNDRLLPVVFEDGDPMQDIPLSLRAFTHYRVLTGYDALLRRITKQPRRVPPPLGQLRSLPPDPRPGPLGGTSPHPAAPRAGIHVDNRGASIGQQISVNGDATLGPIAITMPTPQVAPASPSPSPTPASPSTILLFTANSSDDPLELDGELRAILDALQRSRERDRYPTRISPSVTFPQVIHDLDDYDPAIVHFSGHGVHGELVLADAHGAPHEVAAEHMATLLGTVREPPTLAVFAVCQSEPLAAAATRYTRYAIGFRDSVEDGLFPLFSATFYERLAARSDPDIPRAFALAKLAVMAAGFETARLACLFEHPGRDVTDLRETRTNEARV